MPPTRPVSLPTALPSEPQAEAGNAAARLSSRLIGPLGSLPALAALPGWARPALLASGALVAVDGVAHLLHPASGMVLGLGALAGGWWMLGAVRLPLAPKRIDTLQGWMARCEGLLPQFQRLGIDADGLAQRQAALDRLAAERQADALQLALVGGQSPEASLQEGLVAALRGPQPLQLHLGHPLASAAKGWIWPEGLAASDALVFRVQPPLRASELRWLEAVPAGQPVWLLLQDPEATEAPEAAAELLLQWPGADPERLLRWDGDPASLAGALAPLASWLAREGALLRGRTGRRRLEALHRSWQADLERLRRRQWQQLQQRTQWVVAAGVLVAPLPSLDLLVLASANGLMLREMAQLWDCPWSLEQLRAAATELARAALAQGVVEWSTQALAAAVKLHGATWLVGGALQALSAAYLTRVVGRAMADVLALSAGVSEPDLARIRLEAPLLVARAAEEERLDWAGFLGQARRWWEGQQVQGSYS
jgi:hypothetical protein